MLHFVEKKESFSIENASNLTHDFFYNNFSKIFLLNCHTITHMLNLILIQDKITHLFFFKKRHLEVKVLKKYRVTINFLPTYVLLPYTTKFEREFMVTMYIWSYQYLTDVI